MLLISHKVWANNIISYCTYYDMEPDRSSMRSSQSEGPQIIAHYDQNGHRISRNSFRDSLLDSLI